VAGTAHITALIVRPSVRPSVYFSRFESSSNIKPLDSPYTKKQVKCEIKMLAVIFIKIGFALLANSEATAHSVLQVSLNSKPGLEDPHEGLLSRLFIYLFIYLMALSVAQNTEHCLVALANRQRIRKNGEIRDLGRI
jgi:hypothetical protein